MKTTSHSHDSTTNRWIDAIIHWRWLIILATLLMVFGAGSGGRFLEFSNDYRAFFSSENPELIAFESFQDTYTKNDNILFVVQSAEGEIFNSRIGEAIEKLTEKAWQIPYTSRVDSITNFQHTRANEDELIVEDLLANAKNMDETELATRKAIALAEPLLRNNLISPDTDTTGINVTLQYPQKSLAEIPEATSIARAIATEIQAAYPELTIALSGLSMMNNAFAEAGKTDAMTLVPLMYGVLILLMIITLRSLSATLVTVLVIGFSSLTAMGLAGYMGIKLTPVSVTAPTIILTLAIADSIHIIVSMLTNMREGKDKISALKESIRINFTPITITSITTIVGFLSLNFSDSPPFWHLGNITAIGIFAAWFYSLIFLPATLSLLPVKIDIKQKDTKLQSLLRALADFVIRKRRAILIVMGSISIFLLALVPTIELNDDFVKYFDHRIQFRKDAEFGMKHLNGIYLVEFSIGANGPGGISEPEYLEHLEKFTAWLRTQAETTHVYSYSDIVKRLNKNMHGDDETFYKVPNQRNLAAQYLLLYELSLPYGLDLNDRINIDKSATRVTVSIENITTSAVRTFLDRSEKWLQENMPDYMVTQPTSASVMFAYISQRNIESMIRGNTVAIFLIAIILAIALRSIKLGMFSIIPNATPILMTFGVWALLVGQVGMAAATVTATSLGIVVDDTVHFLSKYLRARREKGLDRAEAIHYAFATVGKAIVLTTIILMVGFSVLAASSFLINAQMGLLTAAAIVMALAFDFLLLPALLLIGYKPEKTDAALKHSTN